MVVVLQISQNTSLKSWPHPSDSVIQNSAYIDLIFTCKYNLVWKKIAISDTCLAPSRQLTEILPLCQFLKDSGS